MSVWTIERVDGKVRVLFTEKPLDEKPVVKRCGEGEAALESEMEAWIFDTASPYDVIDTPRGRFDSSVRRSRPAARSPWLEEESWHSQP